MPDDRHRPPELRLIERLARAPNRAWADYYLELLRYLITETDLAQNDPRLVTSLPNSHDLPVSVNNRYVLDAKRWQQQWVVRIIYGPEMEWRRDLGWEIAWRYDPLYNENLADVPFYLRFADPTLILADEELREGWLAATRVELRRARASPYRLHHQPVVYRAATDLAYRKMILDEAFVRTG